MNTNNYNSNNQNENLKKFAINLCERAREGKLDPVIGRDDEIRRVLQILSRRTKNNPIDPEPPYEEQPDPHRRTGCR